MSTRQETRSCPACGGNADRAVRARVIRYRGLATTIQQPAWWCRECGEGALDSKDAAIADRTFAELRASAEGVLGPSRIAAVRKCLGLSQRKAGEVLGGGARAFQRYEAGAVVISKPMSNLLTMLEQDPALLELITHKDGQPETVDS